MEPYQQRVLDEKAELETRAKALSAFIGTSEVFAGLPEEEQKLLREQCEVMWQYFEILEKRIALFPAEPPAES